MLVLRSLTSVGTDDTRSILLRRTIKAQGGVLIRSLTILLLSVEKADAKGIS